MNFYVLPIDEFNGVLETNASNSGLGAVLLHDDRPLAYFSKILHAHNRI